MDNGTATQGEGQAGGGDAAVRDRIVTMLTVLEYQCHRARESLAIGLTQIEASKTVSPLAMKGADGMPIPSPREQMQMSAAAQFQQFNGAFGSAVAEAKKLAAFVDSQSGGGGGGRMRLVGG